jgi:hypothetical protein
MEADKKWAKEMYNNTPMTKNSYILSYPPGCPPPITVDITTLTKADTSRAHHHLLHELQWNPHIIITYTDSTQLNNVTGIGYTIPAGILHPMKAIVPIGNMVEVFDTELWAIYEYLLTCQKHMW